MLRSIELFPEDGSPVGRTPFILSVLTLRSSHPLGGFPPRPPLPSRGFFLLGASTSMTNLVTPAFLCPDGGDHDVDGASLGSAIVSSLPLIHAPSPLFLCCTTRLNGIDPTCPFFSSFVLWGSCFRFDGVCENSYEVCVCVCVYVHYATFGRGESFVKGWLPCSVCGILISLIRKNFYRLD